MLQALKKKLGTLKRTITHLEQGKTQDKIKI